METFSKLLNINDVEFEMRIMLNENSTDKKSNYVTIKNKHFNYNKKKWVELHDIIPTAVRFEIEATDFIKKLDPKLLNIFVIKKQLPNIGFTCDTNQNN